MYSTVCVCMQCGYVQYVCSECMWVCVSIYAYVCVVCVHVCICACRPIYALIIYFFSLIHIGIYAGIGHIYIYVYNFCSVYSFLLLCILLCTAELDYDLLGSLSSFGQFVNKKWFGEYACYNGCFYNACKVVYNDIKCIFNKSERYPVCANWVSFLQVFNW